ncbi:hypothetical protein ILUMI_03448 [Ignelater luminosus]|uniref:Uncharacterized protein n=1 Tax=Ignelater luminosus TaxID=2038154 RepID=A0A8K0DLT0_IGNLU|nr:hypothetical protein ILUMI_03448 [Ignelater luminosus]
MTKRSYHHFDSSNRKGMSYRNAGPPVFTEQEESELSEYLAVSVERKDNKNRVDESDDESEEISLHYSDKELSFLLESDIEEELEDNYVADETLKITFLKNCRGKPNTFVFSNVEDCDEIESHEITSFTSTGQNTIYKEIIDKFETSTSASKPQINDYVIVKFFYDEGRRNESIKHFIGNVTDEILKLTFLKNYRGLCEPESGAWLNVLPSISLDTLLDKNSFKIAVELRLGLNLNPIHTRVCGEIVLPNGSIAELAANKKRAKYVDIEEQGYLFVPIAVETTGPWIKFRNEDLILALFVDDGLLMGNDPKVLDQFIAVMNRTFECTICDPNQYVGLEIIRDRPNKTIFIYQ